MYVLRQILLGVGVFIGIGIKFTGMIVALPAVPNLLLHGMGAAGLKGAFEPFLTITETAGLFAIGLVIAGCGVGILLYCFFRLGAGGTRAVMAIIFGGAAVFFVYVQFFYDVTIEGRVILGILTLACAMIIVLVVAPTSKPRQMPQLPPRRLTRDERRERFRNSIIESGKVEKENRTYH